MPDGRIQRIDEKQDVVYVLRRGRTYRAPLSEVDADARVPSARVRFDLVRDHGSESAANVRLRLGTRTNRRHRRFGDLSGAKRPGAKLDGPATKSYGVDVTTQPFRVAKAWLEAMNAKDFDGATSLFQSRAELHTPNGSMTGRREVRAELERIDWSEIDVRSADVHGVDRYVMVAMQSTDANERAIYFVIDRGSIVEQWVDCAPDLPDHADGGDAVLVVRHGDVGSDAATYATDRLDAIVEHAGRDVRFARVKLTAADNQSVARPALVEATIEFDNGLVRAHADAATFAEATDHVADRLRRQLEQQHDRQRHRRDGLPPIPDGWQHGNRPRVETPYFDRPAADREIVRHKSIAGEEMTVDEAAWDMAMLDYEFFLFTDLDSGRDALLERVDGSLVVHQLAPVTIDPRTSIGDYQIADQVAPELAVSEAMALLNESGADRLFFCNRETSRANVIYRRYDGHYGLITPSDAPDGEED